MFDKAEAEFRELSEKRGIVENDKSKIQKVRASATAGQAYSTGAEAQRNL